MGYLRNCENGNFRNFRNFWDQQIAKLVIFAKITNFFQGTVRTGTTKETKLNLVSETFIFAKKTSIRHFRNCDPLENPIGLFAKLQNPFKNWLGYLRNKLYILSQSLFAIIATFAIHLTTLNHWLIQLCKWLISGWVRISKSFVTILCSVNNWPKKRNFDFFAHAIFEKLQN